MPVCVCMYHPKWILHDSYKSNTYMYLYFNSSVASGFCNCASFNSYCDGKFKKLDVELADLELVGDGVSKGGSIRGGGEFISLLKSLMSGSGSADGTRV